MREITPWGGIACGESSVSVRVNDVNGEGEICLHNIVLKIHSALSIPYFFI